MPRTRTFIGVDVGDDIRTRAAALQADLAGSGADVKWVEPPNLHVTLLFLGEVDDRELVDVCRAVTAAARRESPFPLRVAGVGAFPTPRRPKILWGGVTDGADNLARLHAAIEAPLLDAGTYRREDRAYTPHLTLGRAKSDEDGNLLAPLLPKLLAWDGGQTMIDEVLVYSSELRRDGPEYTVVARAPLGS
jgi:2'-5' RNA ligase